MSTYKNQLNTCILTANIWKQFKNDVIYDSIKNTNRNKPNERHLNHNTENIMLKEIIKTLKNG